MPARPQKSLAVAYVLWFFFGLFGVHRFYLGNWFTGTLYALSAGFYFVGWFLDLFMLPFLVNSSNQRLRERELGLYEDDEEEDELVLTPVEETVGGPPRLPRKAVKVHALPPPLWARKRRFQIFEFVLQLLFFLIAPSIFVLLALLMEQYVLLAIMVVTMVVCGFLGRVEVYLQSYPMLEKIPALGPALAFLNTATDFYRTNAPFHFAYYLFYPVTAPVAALISPVARREAAFFARVVGGMMLVVVAQFGLSYFEIFPPHLGPVQAVAYAFFVCMMILILILVFIVPTVTAAMTLTAAHKTSYLRVLVVVGLISGLPVTLVYYFSTGAMPVTPTVLLDQRFNMPSFQSDLSDSGTMFLTYWRDRPLGATPLERDALLTDKFRRAIAGHMTGYETRAFQVHTLDDGPNTPRWLVLAAISLQRNNYPPMLLLVAGPDERVYARWQDLPPDFTAKLRVDTNVTPPAALGQPFHVRLPILFDDLKGTKIALNQTHVPPPARHLP